MRATDLAELGQALGYWATRYQPVPGAVSPAGRLTAGQALDAVPRVPDQVGGVAARIPQLAHTSGWTQAIASLQSPATAEEVPFALAALTASYTPAQPWSGPPVKPADSPEAAGRLALENGDEHVIKFTETALRAELRGLAAGRAAAAHALRIIPLDS